MRTLLLKLGPISPYLAVAGLVLIAVVCILAADALQNAMGWDHAPGAAALEPEFCGSLPCGPSP